MTTWASFSAPSQACGLPNCLREQPIESGPVLGRLGGYGEGGMRENGCGEAAQGGWPD